MTDAARTEPDFDVSVVICTRDRRDDLKAMLEHMARATVPSGWRAEVLIVGATVPSGWRAEVLIVDNGSSDDTKSVADQAVLPNVEKRYIFEPRKGKGHAYNAGLAAARGKVFLFTDDDVHVPANWIEEMSRPILDGSADAVQGGVRIAPHLDRPWLKGMLRTWVASVEDPEQRPPGLVGANMAFGRRAVEVAAPFDLRLGPGAAGYFDDTKFGWALERAGLKIHYLPTVAAEHNFDPDRLELSAFMSAARRMAISRAIIDHEMEPAKRPPSFSDLLAQLPGLGVRSLTQLARYALRREPDPGFLFRYYRLKLWQAARALS